MVVCALYLPLQTYATQFGKDVPCNEWGNAGDCTRHSEGHCKWATPAKAPSITGCVDFSEPEKK